MYLHYLFLQVHNPLRLLLALSCVLLLTCSAARFTCADRVEDHLAIAALIMAWPYSLMFCRYGVNAAMLDTLVCLFHLKPNLQSLERVNHNELSPKHSANQ